MPPESSSGGAAQRTRAERGLQVHAEQIRLLFSNADTAVGVTVFVAPVLGFLQWGVVSHPVVLGWFAYMVFVSAARLTLTRVYRRTGPDRTSRSWGAAFSVGAGLSGAGWGAAGVLLYPEAHLTNQVFLAFVLGGMMLGAVSLLSARPEAFLAFLVPAGLPTAARFLLHGDRVHLAMGLLGFVFTINILITAWHIYRTVSVSLELRFENRELVESLQTANELTEALNQRLDLRVRERTAELHEANERLRAEIHQREQAEDELLRARKLESLGVLAGGIAHDFNNFLTIVQGNIALAKLDLQSGSPVLDILDQTAEACERAAALSSQLLTFGKGGAPVRRVVSVTRLIQDAVGLAGAGANVSIHMSVADDLWSADIDAAQVSHALYNILLNARQAMPEGGMIEVHAENFISEAGAPPLSPGKYVKISVRDYGCGIPPDILPRVFDPYFTTKASGTGLGLAVAYAIVAKHEGHITVHSHVGLETTFTIYLPAGARESSPVPEAGGKLRSGSGRILVMDDEEMLRRLLARMLGRLGYVVECARDGAEAIALFEAAKAAGRGFDAVLLDLTVPGGMGGKDASAKLREIDAAVPLIVSSGYSDAPVLSEYEKHGFSAVLRKPWKAAELSEVVRQVIQASRPHAQD